MSKLLSLSTLNTGQNYITILLFARERICNKPKRTSALGDFWSPGDFVSTQIIAPKSVASGFSGIENTALPATPATGKELFDSIVIQRLLVSVCQGVVMGPRGAGQGLVMGQVEEKGW